MFEEVGRAQETGMDPERPIPAYVPGGPWPRPSPAFGVRKGSRIDLGRWWQDPAFQRGYELFDAGYYWEAHDAWESIWHALGRRGAEADLVKGLIKLAAAGVKVRQRQPSGVRTHALGAAALLETLRAADASGQFRWIDLEGLATRAREIGRRPPNDPEPAGARVSVVFDFRLTDHLRGGAPDDR